MDTASNVLSANPLTFIIAAKRLCILIILAALAFCVIDGLRGFAFFVIGWAFSGTRKQDMKISSAAPYTAVVRGVNDTTGVALVEVYALD